MAPREGFKLKRPTINLSDDTKKLSKENDGIPTKI